VTQKTRGRSKRPKHKRALGEPEYYRPIELAIKFNVSADYVWDHIRKGIFPSIKFGRAIFLPKKEVDRIIRENTREAVKV
jgi:Helix-turn-helix domain